MPHFGNVGPSKPLDRLSVAELVGGLIVVPAVVGAALLAFVISYTVRHGAEFTAGDWLCQFGWGVGMGLGLMFALPSVGIGELRRRRRAREAATK